MGAESELAGVLERCKKDLAWAREEIILAEARERILRRTGEVAHVESRMWRARVHSAIETIPVMASPGNEPAWMKALGVSVERLETRLTATGIAWSASLRIQATDGSSYCLRASGGNQ